MISAVTEWDNVFSRVTIVAAQGMLNIMVSHSYPAGVYAQTKAFGENCNSTCFDKSIYCNYYGSPGTQGGCTNAAAVYYVQIGMNPTVIQNEVNAANGIFNLTGFVTATLAHEFGHALRLADVQKKNGICSEVASLMYDAGSVLFACKVTTPQQCDTHALNSIYPSSPLYCPVGPGNYLGCYTSYPSCT